LHGNLFFSIFNIKEPDNRKKKRMTIQHKLTTRNSFQRQTDKTIEGKKEVKINIKRNQLLLEGVSSEENQFEYE